jgi:hypothetical protein
MRRLDFHRYHSRNVSGGIWLRYRPPSAAKAVITKHLLSRAYWSRVRLG